MVSIQLSQLTMEPLDTLEVLKLLFPVCQLLQVMTQPVRLLFAWKYPNQRASADNLAAADDQTPVACVAPPQPTSITRTSDSKSATDTPVEPTAVLNEVPHRSDTHESRTPDASGVAPPNNSSLS